MACVLDLTDQSKHSDILLGYLDPCSDRNRAFYSLVLGLFKYCEHFLSIVSMVLGRLLFPEPYI